jgi:hypothetical protein
VTGRERCNMHGGKTPRGLANPRTITGRYSADMPTRMVARYQEAQQDKEALSIRNEIDFITAAIGVKLQEMEQASQDLDWDKAIAQLDRLTEDGEDWDWAQTQGELRRLGEMLRGGRGGERLMEEVRSLMDQRARLVAQEGRRQNELRQNLTVEEAIVYAQVLAAIVRKYVEDRAVVAAINREFQAVANAPDIDTKALVLEATSARR